MSTQLKKPRGPSTEVTVNEFSEETAQEFREHVLDIAKEDPMKPVIIYIDSYGGAVDSLAKMIETLDEIPNPVITVAIGKAMSCGAVLLSHGDIRLCGKHSRVMIHEVSGGTVGDVHDMGKDVQEVKRLNEYFMDLLAKNCKIKGGYAALRKIIKNQDGRDHFMNAAEALKFGIVDAIGLPHIQRQVTYQIGLVQHAPSILSTVKTKKTKNKRAKKSESKK